MPSHSAERASMLLFALMILCLPIIIIAIAYIQKLLNINLSETGDKILIIGIFVIMGIINTIAYIKMSKNEDY